MQTRHGRMAILALAAFSARAEVKVDTNTFGALEAREIGPAVMSGRVMAIDGVASEPRTFYVGAAGGGVWKTTNGGTTFKAVFDKYTASIGAIAVDPKDPQTVWVGTGEGCPRNSASVGTGLYKTTDGGQSWTFVGLPDSERIARIAIDPKDGDVVYVAALGHLWSPGGERGLYRTKDGGKSWDRLLFVNDGTGCSDVAIDPHDPATLYAAMWQFHRQPDFFVSGGPGSGLHKSTDGGKSWRKLGKGLPQEELGRIALAVAPTEPTSIYTVVESKNTAFYRSQDAGESFARLDSSFNLQVRPFYFSHLVVDPSDPKRVYKLGLTLTVSDDAGESFTTPFVAGGDIHSDLHALWIDPGNQKSMVLGCDGGVYGSRDRGNTWIHYENLPLCQPYHVATDMARPYNVYCGLQDNGSWMGPSESPNGIGGEDWKNVGFGDGFWVLPDPSDPDILYCEFQGGNVLRRHHSTGEIKEIKPYPQAGAPKLRFNWNTPMHQSPTHPEVLYVGAQYLFRTTDKGESWTRMSGDLTTNDPKKQRQEQSGGVTIDNSTAENHCTIFTISESPKDDRVVWVGTDDGNLQVTQDAGGSWTNVAKNVPGLPSGTWVDAVEAGHHDARAAYVAFDGHQKGDMKTYLYRTTDLGKTWTALATEGIKGYAHVLREDLVNPDLLFAGTESGLFVSVDRGAQWAQLTGKLPNVAVYDLTIQPREGDVILATHGRGLYVLDDITPLRHLTKAVLESDAAFLPARPSVRTLPQWEQEFPGDDRFVGGNPSHVATITYYLKKRHLMGDLKVEVYDPEGKLVTTLPGGRRLGINRVSWFMRKKPPKVPPSPTLAGRALFGPMVPAGTYTVKLLKGTETYEGKVEIVPDPSLPHSKDDQDLQTRTVLSLYEMQQDLGYLSEEATSMAKQASERAQGLAKSKLGKDLVSFAESIETLHKTMVATREGFLTGEEELRERVVDLYGAVSDYGGRPSPAQLDRLTSLQGEMTHVKASLDALLAKNVGPLNGQLQGAGKDPLKLITREEFEGKEEGAAPEGLLLSGSGWLGPCLRVR